MIIEWKYCCFLCDNPVGVCVLVENEYEYMAYSHYRYIYNPIPLFMNLMYYKFINKRLRRVCVDCFMRYKPLGIGAIRDREIGKRRIVPRVSQSISSESLTKWIEEMKAFMYPSESDAP